MDKQLYTHFCLEGKELSEHSAYFGYDDVKTMICAISNEIDYVKEICIDLFGDERSSTMDELSDIRDSLIKLKGADQFVMSENQIWRIIHALKQYSSDICISGVDYNGDEADRVQADDLALFLTEMSLND